MKYPTNEEEFTELYKDLKKKVETVVSYIKEWMIRVKNIKVEEEDFKAMKEKCDEFLDYYNRSFCSHLIREETLKWAFSGSRIMVDFNNLSGFLGSIIRFNEKIPENLKFNEEQIQLFRATSELLWYLGRPPMFNKFRDYLGFGHRATGIVHWDKE